MFYLSTEDMVVFLSINERICNMFLRILFEKVNATIPRLLLAIYTHHTSVLAVSTLNPPIISLLLLYQ